MNITAAYTVGFIFSFLLIWAWSWYGLSIATDKLTETESGVITFVLSLFSTAAIIYFVFRV